MKKIVALILSLIAILLLSFVGKRSFIDESKESLHQSGEGIIGSSVAENKVYFLFDNTSPLKAVLSKYYLNGLSVGLQESIDDKKISIVSTRKENFLKQLQNITSTKGSVVFAPEYLYFDDKELLLFHAKGLPLIYFNPYGRGTCIEGNQSPYLWNFGISSAMYSETYLSYLNQKYGQLAKDLTFVMFANRDTEGAGELRYFSDVIDGLGFTILASIGVDEREADLYKVLREMINFSPRVLFANVTEIGGANFFKQAHKLGFGFEMAEALTESVPEELIRLNFPDSNNFIKPSPFIFQNDTANSRAFKDLFRGKEGDLTSSTYRGYISSIILGKIMSAQNESVINFSKELLSLDGIQFEGPSGPFMVHAKARGLIQPLHLGEFKDGTFKYLQYLGDMSPGEECP